MEVCKFLNLKWKFWTEMKILDLIWKFWIWYENFGYDLEVPDLKWMFWIWYGNGKLNREFLVRYGRSGYEMEFLNLKWKFQIWYGNSRSDFEIVDYIRKLWILYGYSGSEMEIPDKMEMILLICMEILGSIFQIFRILADLPSKLLTSLLYVFRPWSLVSCPNCTLSGIHSNCNEIL